ncbi:N-acetyltransferase 5 [Pelomyxa schiedti]|nr:N-acetyltransferase 5 [Pelomyxa schiedti]
MSFAECMWDDCDGVCKLVLSGIQAYKGFTKHARDLAKAEEEHAKVLGSIARHFEEHLTTLPPNLQTGPLKSVVTHTMAASRWSRDLTENMFTKVYRPLKDTLPELKANFKQLAADGSKNVVEYKTQITKLEKIKAVCMKLSRDWDEQNESQKPEAQKKLQKINQELLKSLKEFRMQIDDTNTAQLKYLEENKRVLEGLQKLDEKRAIFQNLHVAKFFQVLLELLPKQTEATNALKEMNSIPYSDEVESFLNKWSSRQPLPQLFNFDNYKSDLVIPIPSEKAKSKSWFSLSQKKKTKAKVFGVSLDELMARQKDTVPNLTIPVFLIFMREAILGSGATNIEGIFRVPGNKSDIDDLQECFDNGNFSKRTENVHNLCALLKQFIRELPIPVIPNDVYESFIKEDFIQSLDCNNVDKLVFSRLPAVHKEVLMFLVRFMQHLSTYAPQTKMAADNLAMVFSPCILHCPHTDTSMLRFTELETTFLLSLVQHTPEALTASVEYNISDISGNYDDDTQDDDSGAPEDDSDHKSTPSPVGSPNPNVMRHPTVASIPPVSNTTASTNSSSVTLAAITTAMAMTSNPASKRPRRLSFLGGKMKPRRSSMCENKEEEIEAEKASFLVNVNATSSSTLNSAQSAASPRQSNPLSSSLPIVNTNPPKRNSMPDKCDISTGAALGGAGILVGFLGFGGFGLASNSGSPQASPRGGISGSVGIGSSSSSNLSPSPSPRSNGPINNPNVGNTCSSSSEACGNSSDTSSDTVELDSLSSVQSNTPKIMDLGKQEFINMTTLLAVLSRSMLNIVDSANKVATANLFIQIAEIIYSNCQVVVSSIEKAKLEEDYQSFYFSNTYLNSSSPLLTIKQRTFTTPPTQSETPMDIPKMCINMNANIITTNVALCYFNHQVTCATDTQQLNNFKKVLQVIKKDWNYGAEELAYESKLSTGELEVLVLSEEIREIMCHLANYLTKLNRKENVDTATLHNLIVGIRPIVKLVKETTHFCHEHQVTVSDLPTPPSKPSNTTTGSGAASPAGDMFALKDESKVAHFISLSQYYISRMVCLLDSLIGTYCSPSHNSPPSAPESSSASASSSAPASAFASETETPSALSASISPSASQSESAQTSQPTPQDKQTTLLTTPQTLDKEVIAQHIGALHNKLKTVLQLTSF